MSVGGASNYESCTVGISNKLCPFISMSLGALIEVALCLYNLHMVLLSLHADQSRLLHQRQRPGHHGDCQCNHHTHHQHLGQCSTTVCVTRNELQRQKKNYKAALGSLSSGDLCSVLLCSAEVRSTDIFWGNRAKEVQNGSQKCHRVQELEKSVLIGIDRGISSVKIAKRGSKKPGPSIFLYSP